MLNTKICFAHFRSKFSEALRQVNKQHLKKHFGFWVLKQFGTTCRVPNCVFKKLLHPNTHYTISGAKCKLKVMLMGDNREILGNKLGHTKVGGG